MEVRSGKFEELSVGAVAHHRAGRLAQAEECYNAALRLRPSQPTIIHNLGIIAGTRGEYRSALNYFDQAIAAAPHYSSAHYNRAVTLHSLGRIHEALQAFGRACAIEPEHYQAHRHLGFLWLAEGDRNRSLDHFARTYELRRGDDRTGIAAQSLTFATREKLLHDAEQFRYLAGRRRERHHFETLERMYAELAEQLPLEVSRLSDEQLETLGYVYNTAIYIRDAPEIPGRAVSNRQDYEQILREFQDHQERAVSVDGLLTKSALLTLRQYLLESTIWHDFDHVGGFVASYLEDGLACPLFLQIADELRSTFPDILGRHLLSQAWAFKGIRSSAAVDAHADDAAVSVNLWITPDDANLDSGCGGLRVCRIPPPADWQVHDYDKDRERIVLFLKQNLGDVLEIPYRENRAVLFKSRLFHWSDAPKFKPGYENHRINITFLFGRHDTVETPL